MNSSMTLSQWHKLERQATEQSLLVKKTNDIIFSKKIKDLDVEDLRLLIGQELLLESVVPLAIELLSNDPMAEGDYFPGDLLKNTLEIPLRYWEKHQEQKDLLKKILIEHRQYILKKALSGAIKLQLQELMESFGNPR
jgi:hypothetical protein